MPNWLIKSAIHRAISWLPRSQLWNELMQTHVTHSLGMTPERLEAKMVECRKFFDSFRARGRDAADFVALELGTGWYPTIPIGLYLCGATEIHTIDIDPLLRPARIKHLLELIEESAGSGILATWLPACRPERVEKLVSLLTFVDLESPAMLLERIGINVIVKDAQAIPLPDHSVDLIFTSGVLEYIPSAVMENILMEFRRVARPDAMMAHRINLVDQYSYFDPSITAFNYLKYTARQWGYLNSPLIWQNRFRLSDYKRVIANSGFRILEEENIAGLEEDLARVELSGEFKHYQRADLLILHSYLAACPDHHREEQAN